jgi:hypothetical protein
MKKIFILLILLGFLIISGISVRAQETPLPEVKAFTIVPPTSEFEVNPGEVKSFMMKAISNQETPLALKLAVFDFIVTDNKGTPYLLSKELEDITPANLKRFAASTWISTEVSEFTLKPKETKDFQVIISVPPDARPGGRYAAVILEPSLGITSAAQRSNVASGTQISTQLGSLISLRIKGPVEEKAEVVQFETQKFFEYGPVEFTTEIANSSDVHIRPKGAIKIKNILGQEVAKLALEERNVFPGASYVYTNTWKTKYLFGRYQANLTASYGQQGKSLSATVFFWAVPVKEVTATLLAIAIIVLLILFFWRRSKKEKTRLEEKLEEEEKEISKLREELKQKSE